MPEISQFYGVVIMMFFDDHNPPHFHVKYNDNMAIINIKNGQISGTLPRRALRMVYDWLDLHQQELLDNWELMKNQKQPNKIEPLD